MGPAARVTRDWFAKPQVSGPLSALEELPRHHHPLDLVGALVDLGDLGTSMADVVCLRADCISVSCGAHAPDRLGRTVARATITATREPYADQIRKFWRA
jgi:hypothetical protein